jgi:hypothetical protein
MANAFLKPEVIVGTALGLLQREIVLPSLVNSYTINDFRFAKNDTISVPIRAKLTARENVLRATGGGRTITSDSLSESSTSVKLTQHVYSAVDITDEELTLDISSFGEQVLTPQIRSVAEKLETHIYNQISTSAYVPGVNDFTWATSTTNAYAAALMVRDALNRASAPNVNRVLLVGPGAEMAILADDKFTPSDNGDGFGASALREATIGRIAGFTVVRSNLLDNDEMYGLTREAFVLGNVAPVVPDGVVFGRSMSHEGFSMRWIRDYDASVVTDRSVVSSYVGTAEVRDGKVPATQWDGDALTGTNPDTTATWAAGDSYNARAVRVTVA